MSRCPGCMGHGTHDFRDADAMIGEHWTEQEIAHARAAGFVYPLGIVECSECDGTGIVSEERALDMRAAAVAAIDQVIARAREEEGLS